MYRHGRVTLIVAGCAAALGAMLLIPSGQQIAVADTPANTPEIRGVTSQETIAAIDAMLAASQFEPVAPQAAATDKLAPIPDRDPNLETAALTTPEPEVPAIDPSLRPGSIGPSAVNLRAGPSTSNATVGVLQPGQALYTGATNGGWVEVTLADGTTGWVYSRYLAGAATAAPDPSDAAKSSKSTAKAVVKGASNRNIEGRTARIDAALAARAKPNGGARTVFRTEPGERVKILDVRGNWLRILTADGSSGWIERAG